MKLISFNVNGVRASVKKGLHDTMNQLDADVYAFQETKATADQTAEALAETGYFVVANQAERAGYSGTAIACKHEPISTFVDMGVAEHDQEGRITGAEFEDFYLVNVYVPNSGNGLKRLEYRQQWDADFKTFLQNLQTKKPVILCGDLNVAHSEMDIARPKANYNKTAGYTQQEIDGLDNLLSAGFVDSFRQLHPHEVKYSWWSFRGGARQKNIGWRLDYFLVDQKLMPKVASSFILNDVLGSDHCPVGVELES